MLTILNATLFVWFGGFSINRRICSQRDRDRKFQIQRPSPRPPPPAIPPPFIGGGGGGGGGGEPRMKTRQPTMFQCSFLLFRYVLDLITRLTLSRNNHAPGVM